MERRRQVTSSLLKSSRSAMFPAMRATPHLARRSHACQKRGIVCKTEASSANIVRPLHVVKVARDCCRLSKRRRTSTSHRVASVAQMTSASTEMSRHMRNICHSLGRRLKLERNATPSKQQPPKRCRQAENSLTKPTTSKMSDKDAVTSSLQPPFTDHLVTHNLRYCCTGRNLATYKHDYLLHTRQGRRDIVCSSRCPSQVRLM